MNIIEKIEQLEKELEDAWDHNRFIQDVLEHARKLGHNIEEWIEHVLCIDDDDDDDPEYC